MAQPTPSPEDRFHAFSARSQADPEGPLRVDFVEKVACRDDALLIQFFAANRGLTP
jgi:hypothetical protein